MVVIQIGMLLIRVTGIAEGAIETLLAHHTPAVGRLVAASARAEGTRPYWANKATDLACFKEPGVWCAPFRQDAAYD